MSQTLPSQVKVAASLPSRLRGLLFTRPGDCMLVLVPCHDVHTMGMAYDLDIAFLDGSLHVLEAHKGVKPGRRLACPGAWATLERAAQPGQAWYEPGSRAGPAVREALAARLGGSRRRPPRGAGQCKIAQDGTSRVATAQGEPIRPESAHQESASATTQMQGKHAQTSTT